MMRRLRAIHGLAGVALTAGGVATLAWGCSTDNAVVGGSCASGYTECDYRCVDLETDPANCGACGHACPPGVVCSGGVCGAPVDAAGDAPVDAPADAYDGALFDAYTSDAPADGYVPVDAPADASDASPVDACTPPYDTPAACGDCFTVCTGINDQCILGDAGFACGPLCTPPLTECAGTCVNFTNDPDNCGGCGIVCQSQICQNSKCVGSTTGDVVLVGHDYLKAVAGTSQAQVIDNAVFIPAKNPLPVLAYQRYSDPKAVKKVNGILSAYATSTSRTLAITATSTDADIPNTLTIENYAVLLVYDQANAPSGALGPLGTSWQSTLATFTKAGGVVVVLDGGNAAEAPVFVTDAGLFNMTAQTSIAPGTQVTDIAPGDAVGVGVVSPYAVAANSVDITADPPSATITYVIFDTNANLPVVLHRTVN